MSFIRTGSTVAVPGLAPRSSSTACGGCCSSENSGVWDFSVSSESFFCFSFSSWDSTCSQLFTLAICFRGRKTSPVTSSLMTTTLRLVRNTGCLAEASSGCWVFS